MVGTLFHTKPTYDQTHVQTHSRHTITMQGQKVLPAADLRFQPIMFITAITLHTCDHAKWFVIKCGALLATTGIPRAVMSTLRFGSTAPCNHWLRPTRAQTIIRASAHATD